MRAIGERRLGAAVALGLLLALVAPAALAAQSVLTGTERLDGARPEAWAMRWFAGALAPGGFGPAGELRPGGLELALEVGWLPGLSPSERRVGFAGGKVEDIDRTSLYARPRLRVGLPARLALEVDWLPPVEVGGARADLPSLALAGALSQRGRWRSGWRASWQDGEVEGDFTCPRDVARSTDPRLDPMGCEAASRDRLVLESIGGELGLAWQPRARRPLELAGSLRVRRLDASFRVDARYDGIVDRVRLDYSGTEWGARLGAAWQATHWRAAGELSWVPLAVERPGRGRRDEPLIHLRLAVSRRWR
jgi:hypothetical protein